MLKRKHYGKVYDLQGIDLIPFAVEVWGYLGESAVTYIDNWARTMVRWHQHPERGPYYRKHKYQYTGRISSALMRGTGAQLDNYVYRCRRARGLLQKAAWCRCTAVSTRWSSCPVAYGRSDGVLLVWLVLLRPCNLVSITGFEVVYYY
jgi:hypothetical protein